MSEHSHQVALFDWASLSLGAYPELRWMFAIPNGGHRSKATAGKLKAEGVKAGVFDICLPVARGVFNSLWVEMKYGDNKLSPAQVEFRDFIEGQGGKCVTCWDWESAKKEIEDYLKGSL